MTGTPTRAMLLRYALFALPLGFLGIPLYVHLPKYYADTLPVSLSAIGAALFATRLLDCLADPWIGYYCERFPRRRKPLMFAGCSGMGVGVVLLFALPSLAPASQAVWWVGLLLSLTYLSYSVATINYYAAGLPLAQNYAETSRLSAWRESAIIIGVLLASALPPLLMQRMGEIEAYRLFSYSFIGALILGAAGWLAGWKPSDHNQSACLSPWQALAENRELRWIFGLFFVNAVAPSITATLFLFFASDVLLRPELAGAFLVVYFLSAMLAMPLWAALVKRYGKRQCLMGAMCLAVSSFIWAYGLGAGDVAAFYVICFLSGVALAGDLAILPALLADALSGQKRSGALEFGIWNFISKLTLALAAGISLPALEALGYAPGSDEPNLHALSVAYALLPCAFKLLAFFILTISPIDKKGDVL